MIKKSYSKSGTKCKVTFKMPSELPADSVNLVGEFNEWNLEGIPMKKLKDGSYSATLSLQSGKSYRYRYLLDGAVWENDWEPDAYEPNEFGTENSVLII